MPELRLPKTETNLFMIKSIKSKTIIALLLMLFWLAQSSFAQAPPNSTIPSAFQGGAAAGSYPLSGFENINYFNGNLGVNLPLVTVGGRGEASFTMMLTIGQSWKVDITRELTYCTDNSNPASCHYRNIYTPNWERNDSSFKAGLGPGAMSAMHTGRYTASCSPGQQAGLGERLTTLTFAMPGGSTVELRDRQYDGKPLPGAPCQSNSNGPSRGNIFDSKDGSGMTFISDTIVEDKWVAGPEPVSGTLYLKSGVRYRFDNGGVTSITDRNGNKIVFYNDNGVGVAKDSLDREVRTAVTYEPGIKITTITTKRAGEVTRAIKIYSEFNDWDNSPDRGLHLLRSDYTQLLTYPNAFPELNGAQRFSGTAAINGISRVELPDGRNYRFYYNQYSDIARIELPTGGAFEYDWTGAGTTSGAVASSPDADPQTTHAYVYRRVDEASGL